MRSTTTAFLALAAAAGCSSETGPPAASEVPLADLTLVEGTHVRMLPPSGALPADGFAGFEHLESATSVRVIEFGAPFREVASGFTDPKALADQGLSIETRESVPNGSFPGELLVGTQESTGLAANLVLWIFGAPGGTVLVQGTYVDDARAEDLRTSVLSARWDAQVEVDPTAGLEFELATTEDLKLWQRLGDLLAYTLDGRPDVDSKGDPMFMIGPGPALPIEDREAFVRERTRQLPLRSIEIESLEPIQVDGLDGFQVTVRALDPATGAARAAYQTILFDPPRHWMAIGVCAADRAAVYLPMFERITRGLRRDAGGE